MKFYKMQGAGNDFVFVEENTNKTQTMEDLKKGLNILNDLIK